MFGFLRKKEEIEERVGSKGATKIRHGVSDRKKEPKKPWGKKERSLVAGILLITLGLSIASWLSQNNRQFSLSPIKEKLTAPETIEIRGENLVSTPETIQTEKVRVTKVIDGDTIVVQGDRIIRYIGMDTPERNICFFKEAKDANEKLVLGKDVEMEKDVSETDKYGRSLRYLWIDGMLVNEELVRDGYAQVSTYPPDVKYQERFLAAQNEARENGKGIWAPEVCKANSGASLQPAAANNDSASPVLGAQEDKDCTDFSTHEAAQEFFISQGGPQKDPHRLDSDSDGIACESLP